VAGSDDFDRAALGAACLHSFAAQPAGEMARTHEIHVDGSPQPLLGTVLRSDDGRAEEAFIKGRARTQQEANGCLSSLVGAFVTLSRTYLLGNEARVVVPTTEKQGGNGEDPAAPLGFSLFAPGSAAINDSSLFLDPGSGNALRLIAGTVIAYVGLNVAVLALTPTTLALSQYEHTAVALTLSIQVASLLHDALARQRISKSERDTHLCIVVVKVLAALTNAMLWLLPSTPFVTDMVTGRHNSMLRWAEWCVLAFTITFIVEAIDSTEARTPLLVAASQSLSTLCGLFLPLASVLPAAWGLLLVVSFLLYFYIFARLFAKQQRLQLMRASLPPNCYALVRAELGIRLLWQCVITWTALTAVWSADALVGRYVERGATSWCFIADCVIDCVAKALYTTAIMEQVDTATQLTSTRKEARRRARLHW